MQSAPLRATLPAMSADTKVLEPLAFLYLTFGHSTDGELGGDEMRALAGKLREWAPEVELGDLGQLLKDSVAKYKSSGDKLGDAKAAGAALKGALDSEALGRVLADLESLAAADGQVVEAEREFIEQTRKDFGLG